MNMGAIKTRLDGIMCIVDLKYRREEEHIKRMQQASTAVRPRSGPLQHLKAQADSIHNLMRLIQP